jgi:high-affinity K+ transport system ATPase subunit B
VPFTAQTRMSGVDLTGARFARARLMPSMRICGRTRRWSRLN